MITFMSDIVCVTNRHLTEEFLPQLSRVAAAKPAFLILREKDLKPEEYRVLAKEVLAIAKKNKVPCVLHTFYEVAAELGADAIHLPLPLFLTLSEDVKKQFSVIGVSVHTKEEALLAQKLGASYLTAGHVFATECKAGLPPRGLSFLKEVCEAVELPVYAIGGIHEKNAADCRKAGAKGVCLMSALMQEKEPENLIKAIDASLHPDI